MTSMTPPPEAVVAVVDTIPVVVAAAVETMVSHIH